MTVKMELANLCDEINKLDFDDVDAFELERLSMKLTSLVERIYQNQESCSSEDLQLLKQHSQKLLDSVVTQKDNLKNSIEKLPSGSKPSVSYLNDKNKS